MGLVKTKHVRIFPRQTLKLFTIRLIRLCLGSVILALCFIFGDTYLKLFNNLIFNVASGEYNTEIRVQYPLTLTSDYVLNSPEICPVNRHVTALVLVHSAADHFQQRDNIRFTYGSRTTFHPAEVRVVFLIGLVMNLDLQETIQSENTKYQDTIQGNFLDSYKNLTNKGVMGLRWISEFCQNVKYVVKVDDDVIFDMWRFLDYFASKNVTRNIFCAPIYYGLIFRKGKWSVSDDEFKDVTVWPWPYCPGFVVIVTGDVIPLLLKAAHTTPFLWIDDVYIYGYLPFQAGNITLKEMPTNLGITPEEHGQRCLQVLKGTCPMVGVGTDVSKYKYLWEIMKMRNGII